MGEKHLQSILQNTLLKFKLKKNNDLFRSKVRDNGMKSTNTIPFLEFDITNC